MAAFSYYCFGTLIIGLGINAFPNKRYCVAESPNYLKNVKMQISDSKLISDRSYLSTESTQFI